MGLMKKIITKTVVKGAEKAVMKTARKELNKRRSVDALTANSQFSHKLIIQKNFFSLRKSSVSDTNGKKKYQIKSNMPVVGKHSMKLYDMADVELGSVWKAPLISCYAVSLNGVEIGSATRTSANKILFETDYANWTVHGNAMQWDFEAFDSSNNVILKVHSAFWSGSDSYVMEYVNINDEKLGLLLLMAIALIRVQ